MNIRAAVFYVSTVPHRFHKSLSTWLQVYFKLNFHEKNETTKLLLAPVEC